MEKMCFTEVTYVIKKFAIQKITICRRNTFFIALNLILKKNIFNSKPEICQKF